MADDDVDGLSLEVLFNTWPAGIRGSLLRRAKKSGHDKKVWAYIRDYVLKDQRMKSTVESLRSRQRYEEEEDDEPPPRRRRRERPLTLGDLNGQEQGLIQAMRTHYKKLFNQNRVPWAGVDWKVAFVDQIIQPEAATYLRHWHVWKDWKPPKNISLKMVKALLEKWAEGEMVEYEQR